MPPEDPDAGQGDPGAEPHGASGRLAAAIALIDAANAADPERILEAGEARPAALVYGRRMSAALAEFRPDASELLQIAVRGSHVERWKIPRASYPEGRAGYLRWRADLGRYHAERVAGIMRAVGYDAADCARTARIVRKEGIKRDPEVQTFEDVACLVFLRWYAADFAARHAPEKVRDILARTARKMSPEGRRAAAELGLPREWLAAMAG